MSCSIPQPTSIPSVTPTPQTSSFKPGLPLSPEFVYDEIQNATNQLQTIQNKISTLGTQVDDLEKRYKIQFFIGNNGTPQFSNNSVPGLTITSVDNSVTTPILNFRLVEPINNFIMGPTGQRGDIGPIGPPGNPGPVGYSGFWGNVGGAPSTYSN